MSLTALLYAERHTGGAGLVAGGGAELGATRNNREATLRQGTRSNQCRLEVCQYMGEATTKGAEKAGGQMTGKK